MEIFSLRNLYIILLLALIFWACKNPFDELSQTKTPVSVDVSKDSTKAETILIKECNLVKYSDTLFYLKNQTDDYKIEPTERHDGEYGAIPDGLEINNNNGEINLTKSESGIKYLVYFVPKNTTDTCFTKLAISGIDYLSKIYFLDKGDTLVIPIYNSNSSKAIPGGRKNGDGGDDDGTSGGSGSDDNSGNSGSSGSSGSGSDDNSGSSSGNSGSSGSSGSGSDDNSGNSSASSPSTNTPTDASGSSPNISTGSNNLAETTTNIEKANKSGGSEFDDDDDDDNGNGTLDEPLPGLSVIVQGLAIDKINGKIFLKKSIKNGVFGGNPKNGDTKKLKIYYRLDDASGKALNKIEIQLHYFSNSSDIPQSLKDDIEIKQQISKGGKIKAPNQVLRPIRKPRPPDIVIVGRYQ